MLLLESCLPREGRCTLPTDSEGECLPNELSFANRRDVDRISGECEGVDERDIMGEGVVACVKGCSNGFVSSAGGDEGIGSRTIAGIPSASALRVRRLSSREAKNRLRQYIVRRRPRTRSRLTRSVTRSVFALRMSRSSSLYRVSVFFSHDARRPGLL